MSETTEQCDTLAFYDVVDNLVDGTVADPTLSEETRFDFNEELSTDMCDVYELPQEKQSRILLNIDYAAESITILRKKGETEEILRFFTGEDFNPNLASNIVAITYEAFQ
jgi:hypothetical protein